MQRLYFDYNILEDIAKDKIEVPESVLRNSTYISVAHFEEYNRAEINDIKKENATTLEKIMRNLSIVAKNRGILNPSKERIVNRHESVEDCLARIRNNNTNEIIYNKADKLNNIYTDYANRLREKSKDSMNNSNLDERLIWERPEVKECIYKFAEYQKHYNLASYMSLEKVYGKSVAERIMRNHSIETFELKNDCFKNKIVPHATIECVIEYLNNALNECNYHRDKTLRTVNSGIYDIEHSIYATYCTHLITKDANFISRINAIYYFLGLPTRAMTYNTYITQMGV